MKNLFLFFVAVSVLFVMGCQENTITDPVSIEPTSKAQQDLSRQGIITLERVLADPYPVMNSFFILNGEIEYVYRLEVSNSDLAVQQYSGSVQLNIFAGLTYLCTVCSQNNNNEEPPAGFISSQSTDTVTLTENGKYILEKSYLIQGREDGMVLICRFLVTTRDISIAEMFLVLPEIES